MLSALSCYWLAPSSSSIYNFLFNLSLGVVVVFIICPERLSIKMSATTTRIFAAAAYASPKRMVKPQLYGNGGSAGRYYYSSSLWRNNNPIGAATIKTTTKSTSTSTFTTRTALHQYHTAGDGDNKDDNNRLCAPRASKACELLPTYLADARAVQKYSADTPDGALQLSVAENQMLEDLLIPSLQEFYSTQAFPADAIYYQPTHGRPSFRNAFCGYLEDLLQLTGPMDREGIVVGAGCNAVLENLCICLAEPGEGVLIPTPYYAAFEFDLVARARK
jgi:hypothetical protein